MPTTPVADHLLPFELEYHPITGCHPGSCRGCTAESPRWGTGIFTLFCAGLNTKVLESLKPDLIIGDEAHNLRNRKSTRTMRLLRYISIKSEVSRLKAVTNIPHTKPDLRELASLIAVRPTYKFYGLRAVPISASEYIGSDALCSAIWVDGKPLGAPRADGAAAIVIPSTGECASFADWERTFNRSFNLLRQYALTHCDDSPMRMYKFLVLGSNEAEPLDEDFEISMIGAKVLSASRLACIAPMTADMKEQCAQRLQRVRLAEEASYRTPLANLAEVREAFADNIPDEFRSAAALMATEIGDPDKLW